MAVKHEAGGHRRRQAEATKREVARAARALFAEQGYAATTIAAIAEAADIPAPTIYSAFGSKARILDKVTELWMAEAETLARADAALEAPHPGERLRMLAELNRRQLELGSDIVVVYTEAARADPHMAETMRNVLAAREREIRRLVTTLSAALRPELTVERALDLTLALTLPEVYQTLVDQRGWTATRYQQWLGDALVQQLLAPS